MAELRRLCDVAMVAIRQRGGEAAGLPAIGRARREVRFRTIAIGPDEWLAVSEDGDGDALATALQADGRLTVDVSGNRVCYRVTGEDALDLLAAGCAFDLEAMRTDDAVSTLLARAQVIIVAEAEGSFLVLPRRSFASYLEAWARAAVGK